MNDTRGQHCLDNLAAALKQPVAQCLDDACTNVVDIVEDGIATLTAAELNQLDAARWYINRAMSLHQALVGCVESAQQQMAVALSDNVVELHPETRGGAA